MKIVIYSYDINHIIHWEKILQEPLLVDEINELRNIKECIVVLAYENGSEFELVLKVLAHNRNLVLILDNVPTLTKAKVVLRLGARGYGNTLMSQVYMHSAIETIQSDNIWFIPTLTKELIQSINIMADEVKIENVLKNLTSKEKEIALLLKEGHYNQEVADKLNISINTVKSHIKNIYAKVGVKDKFSLISMMR